MKPYCSDVVPVITCHYHVISSFLGGAADAINLAGLIVRFAGAVITDWSYAKFRAQVMQLIHKQMSDGYGGCDVIDFRLNESFEYNETHGKARWEAYYTFGKKERKVHNVINAEFQFKDGKIINHVDKFNLYKWAKKALGFKGFLVGWTAYFERKLNQKTQKQLSNFEMKLQNNHKKNTSN